MLDSDDRLEKNALKILSGELDKDWEIDVAYWIVTGKQKFRASDNPRLSSGR